MKKVFPSKIGWGLVGIIGSIWGGVTTLLLWQHLWWVAAFMILLMTWMAHLFGTTRYIIEGEILEIKSGFFYHQKINISEIQKIIETNNPLSSPAASLDRLEIRKSPWDYVLISPKEKEEFISELLKINPSIEVKRRKKK